MATGMTDDHLQEAGPSGWSFARGWPLQMIICKRPASPDDHPDGQQQQKQQPGVMGQKEKKKEEKEEKEEEKKCKDK